MSAATYLAWNGQSYPWPPPEGWYEAADGRWWAAGSGPGPAPNEGAVTGTTTLDTTAQEPLPPPPQDPQPPVSEPSQATTDDHGTMLTDRTAPMAEPVTGLGPAGAAPGANEGLSGGHGGPPIGPLPGQRSGPAPWQPTPPQTQNENRTPLIIASAAAGVLVIAALAVVAITRGTDRNDSNLPSGDGGQDSTEGEAIEDPATTPVDQPSASEQTGDKTDGSSPDSNGSDSTATSAVPSTTAAGATTSTAAPTTSTSVSSIDTLTDAEKVAEFRAILQTNGLNSDQLTDEDLVEFGTSFCIFALAADDFDEYVRFREEAIGQSESDLSGADLTLAVDAAVQVFCPDEAVRLGIGG